MKVMASVSIPQIILVAICCMFCCRSTALPAITTYSAMSRAGALNGDGDPQWPSDPSADVEMYKLLYEIANTVERPPRHADGLFTSGYSKLLGQLSAKDYLDSLLAKRVSDELGSDQLRMKRHSDAVFTDNYSRFRKQMAAKKYLDAVLAGKRSPEDALSLPNQSKSSESSLQQSYEDPVDQILQQFPLV
ncbi:vasoactive intestinal peptide b [Hoplias malabaricus]|uniref:vasoactive intestinal peptide b n=1 Tax=Hoplias malabaricus TaxID=27720 RepID=UPI0034625A47